MIFRKSNNCETCVLREECKAAAQPLRYHVEDLADQVMNTQFQPDFDEHSRIGLEEAANARDSVELFNNSVCEESHARRIGFLGLRAQHACSTVVDQAIVTKAKEGVAYFQARFES